MKYKTILLTGAILLSQIEVSVSGDHHEDQQNRSLVRSMQELRHGQQGLSMTTREQTQAMRQHQSAELQGVFRQEGVRTQEILGQTSVWVRDDSLQQVEVGIIHPGFELVQKDKSSYEQSFKQDKQDKSKSSFQSKTRDQKESDLQVETGGKVGFLGIGAEAKTTVTKKNTNTTEREQQNSQETESKREMTGSINSTQKSFSSMKLNNGELQIKLTKK